MKPRANKLPSILLKLETQNIRHLNAFLQDQCLLVDIINNFEAAC